MTGDQRLVHDLLFFPLNNRNRGDHASSVRAWGGETQAFAQELVRTIISKHRGIPTASKLCDQPFSAATTEPRQNDVRLVIDDGILSVVRKFVRQPVSC